MREKFILNTLLEAGEVIWKPHGNSMAPRINSGDQVKLISTKDLLLQTNDIVYAKVKGSYYLHLLTAIDEDRYQISNNHGYVNGWVSRDKVFGICVQVKDKILLSETDLNSRRI